VTGEAAIDLDATAELSLPEDAPRDRQWRNADIAEAARFASWLAGDQPVTWQYFPERGADAGVTAAYRHGLLSEVATLLQDVNAGGAGVFVMVNSGDGHGRKTSNVSAVRALFVDLDGAPVEPIWDCGLLPHAVIESSPGRWHAYWKVSDCKLDQFKPLQRALAARFGGDPSVCDLPRVMRVPGFVHCKGEPFVSRILQLADTAPYSVETVIAGLSLEFEQAEPKGSAASGANGSKVALEGAHPSAGGMVPEGGRNRHLASLAGRLNGQGLSPAALSAALQEENVQRCSPPLSTKEVSSIAAGISSRYAAQRGSRIISTAVDGSAPWPELDALPEPVRSVAAPFPMDALGPVLGPAAKSIARIVQVPDAMAAASVLACASLAAQPHADVRLPHGVVPLSLYIITSAGSGDRKTATDKVANKVFLDIRQAKAREIAKLEQEYAKDILGGQRGDRNLPRPTVSVPLAGKATVESLQRALKSQSSIGIFTSEGGEFVGGHSMREDRRASGLAWYLNAWDGGDLTDMTITHGTSIIVGRRVAMHVLLQPVLLARLLSDPLAVQQGLIPRMLISEPQSLAGTRLYRPENASIDPDVQRYNAAIKRLAEVDPPTLGEGDPYELSPKELRISTAAIELWTAFFNETEGDQATGSALEQIRPFASKVAEHAARIAGVLALVSDPNTYEVDEVAMRGAIEIARFFLHEHVRLTGSSVENAHLDRLRALLDWLPTRRQPVPGKEILQHSPRAIRHLKAEGIQPLLAELEARGYVRQVFQGWEIRP